MYLRYFGLRKTWLNKSPKSTLSEDSSESDMQGGANTVEICTAPPLPYLLTTANAILFEKMSLSDMQSLKDVC